MTGFHEKLAQTCENCFFLCPNYQCAKKIRGVIKKEQIHLRGKYCPVWEYNDPEKALGESTYKSILSFDKIMDKVKLEDFLDLKVLELVCASAIVTIRQLQELIEPFEALLIDDVTFTLLASILDRFYEGKLVEKVN
ncbi:MAG: hypothetical protein KAR35_08815 [Candidatus Heimdallarchaeota archaeon]|nr:hypothetical protein [Candidatus Heimdallarchaeota archaeon]MCK5049458.1 hypothetical protein [Candidatus Heimdallarchaeota archaeon]